MSTKTETIRDEAGNLADAARGMVDATLEAAGEAGEEVRKQIDAVVDRGKEVYDNVSDTAAEGARTTDAFVHEQPYKSLAIAVGVGVLLGYLFARR